MDPAADLGLLENRKCNSELPSGFFAEPDGSGEPSPKHRSARRSINTEVSPFRRVNGVFLEHSSEAVRRLFVQIIVLSPRASPGL